MEYWTNSRFEQSCFLIDEMHKNNTSTVDSLIKGCVIVLSDGKIVSLSKSDKGKPAKLYLQEWGTSMNIQDIFLLPDSKVTIEDALIFLDNLLQFNLLETEIEGIVRMPDGRYYFGTAFLDATVLPAEKTKNDLIL